MYAWIVLDMGQVIAHDFLLGGLRMRHQEWLDMDEPSRLELLRVLIETSPPRVHGEVYESYEIIVDPTALEDRDAPARPRAPAER